VCEPPFSEVEHLLHAEPVQGIRREVLNRDLCAAPNGRAYQSRVMARPTVQVAMAAWSRENQVAPRVGAATAGTTAGI
jgi:hypothetical protein